jgi:hypothetical protein
LTRAKRGLGSHPTLWITAAVTLASLVLLAGVGAGGWPGEQNGCREEMRPTCFCETPRDGLVAQPTNTFSNFGFIAAGLLIAWVADRGARGGATGNPLTRPSVRSTTFAVVTALLGPGSMCLHASQTLWGGTVDVASMYLYAALLIGHGLTRDLSVARFLVTFVVLAAAVIGAQALFGLSVEVTFGGMLALGAGIEVRLARKPGARTLDYRLALLAAGCFALAFAVWVPSLGGNPWCDPESWIQGHGVWHLLCAAAAATLFFYYRSERAGQAL